MFQIILCYDVSSLIAAMLSVFSVVQTNPKYYRVLYDSNSMVWIVYDFLAGAYGNLATHIILFVSTFLAILIRDRKTSRNI
ncbi:MAG: YgjV family protein [Ruminococcaceae bacterium]|nr:YgjV family protein [Oscillospiraceae bacterium]